MTSRARFTIQPMATSDTPPPAQLTQALAKGARDMGANDSCAFCPATGVSREGEEWYRPNRFRAISAARSW